MKNVITFNDLKKASKLWCEKNKKMFTNTHITDSPAGIIKTKGEICYMWSNVIWNNVSHKVLEPEFHFRKNRKGRKSDYKKINDDIKKNGWSKEWPLRILFDLVGGISVGNGNHRINLLSQYDSPILVPVDFGYDVKEFKVLKEINWQWE